MRKIARRNTFLVQSRECVSEGQLNQNLLVFRFDDFSTHSREQYSDSFEPEPIARSAGTQVPHAAQRINLFSVLIFYCAARARGSIERAFHQTGHFSPELEVGSQPRIDQ